MIDYYTPDIINATDYYPFGMPSRVSLTGKGYRFGFNGKENDNDVKGWGNQQDYGMRIYDPRIGKFLSVDPLTYSYPYYTPYQFAGNMPIVAIDLDGLEQYIVIYEKNKQNKIFKTSIYTMKVGTELIDQKIKKVNKASSKSSELIAKGNVLVFETNNSENLKQKLSVVEKRNNPQSKLSPQEAQILKSANKQIENTSKDTRFEFPDTESPEFVSNDFESPKFYEASKIEPLMFQGYTGFTGGGFKDGPWIHAKVVNGKSVLSNELTEYLLNVKKDESAKGITVTLNYFTRYEGLTDQHKENIKREYKKYVSRITGISLDKVSVVGEIKKGDSQNSTVKIEVKQ